MVSTHKALADAEATEKAPSLQQEEGSEAAAFCNTTIWFFASYRISGLIGPLLWLPALFSSPYCTHSLQGYFFSRLMRRRFRRSLVLRHRRR